MANVPPPSPAVRRAALRVVAGGSQSSRGETAPDSLDGTLDFDSVFRRYAPYVAAIAFKILGRDDDLDDLVQEVFIHIHKGLGRLQDPNALKSWLATIAVRRARRRLRAAWLTRLVRSKPIEDAFELTDPGASPEERAHVRSVYRQLDRLPASERVVWVLRHIEDEPLERVAELCGCSVSTVQRRLRSAGRLMSALEGER